VYPGDGDGDSDGGGDGDGDHNGGERVTAVGFESNGYGVKECYGVKE
jgi:hypothetical protein